MTVETDNEKKTEDAQRTRPVFRPGWPGREHRSRDTDGPELLVHIAAGADIPEWRTSRMPRGVAKRRR